MKEWLTSEIEIHSLSPQIWLDGFDEIKNLDSCDKVKNTKVLAPFSVSLSEKNRPELPFTKYIYNTFSIIQANLEI